MEPDRRRPRSDDASVVFEGTERLAARSASDVAVALHSMRQSHFMKTCMQLVAKNFSRRSMIKPHEATELAEVTWSLIEEAAFAYCRAGLGRSGDGCDAEDEDENAEERPDMGHDGSSSMHDDGASLSRGHAAPSRRSRQQTKSHRQKARSAASTAKRAPVSTARPKPDSDESSQAMEDGDEDLGPRGSPRRAAARKRKRMDPFGGVSVEHATMLARRAERAEQSPGHGGVTSRTIRSRMRAMRRVRLTFELQVEQGAGSGVAGSAALQEAEKVLVLGAGQVE